MDISHIIPPIITLAIGIAFGLFLVKRSATEAPSANDETSQSLKRLEQTVTEIQRSHIDSVRALDELDGLEYTPILLPTTKLNTSLITSLTFSIRRFITTRKTSNNATAKFLTEINEQLMKYDREQQSAFSQVKTKEAMMHHKSKSKNGEGSPLPFSTPAPSGAAEISSSTDAKLLEQVAHDGREILLAKRQEILNRVTNTSEEVDYRKEIVIHIPSGEYDIDDDGWEAFDRLRKKYPDGEMYKQRVLPLLSEWKQ